MKKLCLLLWAMFIFVFTALGQSLNQDSLNKANTARADAEFFKLNKEQLKMFRNKRFAENSDYFKPTLVHTSNVSLLNDSVYVKVFKNKAYQKALLQKKRTVGHYVLIGTGVYFGISVVTMVAFVLWLAAGGNLIR
ncbi:MAG: hypothetical protein EAZ51_01685 [Sphingobacteriales bacterium]|nr:MAG: hypothetical protein EAZ64_05155 [Sphingobacteriales bacterium]TAF82813.1 MAG: hypothetical protein EAZ51_01685 [Sphingobacteriales bacterium]